MNERTTSALEDGDLEQPAPPEKFSFIRAAAGFVLEAPPEGGVFTGPATEPVPARIESVHPVDLPPMVVRKPPPTPLAHRLMVVALIPFVLVAIAGLIVINRPSPRRQQPAPEPTAATVPATEAPTEVEPPPPTAPATTPPPVLVTPAPPVPATRAPRVAPVAQTTVPPVTTPTTRPPATTTPTTEPPPTTTPTTAPPPTTTPTTEPPPTTTPTTAPPPTTTPTTQPPTTTPTDGQQP